MDRTPTSVTRLRPTMSFAEFSHGDYTPGRGLFTQLAWYAVSAVIFESKLVPVNGIKRSLLRLFGATVGEGVVIKPDVRIKFPWRLAVGDYSWIGESAWIDNLAQVTIGSNVCLSQSAYLCTGSHDAYSVGFDLIVRPITIEDGAWIAARAVVLQGVTVGRNAIVGAGVIATKNVAQDVRLFNAPPRIIDPGNVPPLAANL